MIVALKILASCDNLCYYLAGINVTDKDCYQFSVITSPVRHDIAIIIDTGTVINASQVCMQAPDHLITHRIFEQFLNHFYICLLRPEILWHCPFNILWHVHSLLLLLNPELTEHLKTCR
jgi:hypothetical protein